MIDEEESKEGNSRAPQPPARRNPTLVRNAPPPPASPATTDTNKADAVAKMVQKSVQMGSLPVDSSEVPPPTKPLRSAPVHPQNQHPPVIKSASNTAGSTLTTSGQHRRQPSHPEINNHHHHHTASTSINASAMNSVPVPLPWILLNGEYLVLLNGSTSNDQTLSAANSLEYNSSPSYYSEIIFVMPTDNRGIRGKLYITNFRLYFKSDEAYWLNYNNNMLSNLIIDLPLGLINRIEKIGHQSSKQSTFYGLLISCKNGRRLRFANTQSEKGVRKQIYDLLHKYAFPLSNNLNFYAYDFYKHVQQNTALTTENGWLVYDVRQEYERMGMTKSEWRFSSINQHFSFCETYPKVLVVPASVSDDDLRQIGQFRSKHRIPVVSWLKYDSRRNCVALLRSSQPLVGLPPQKRSEKDENYLYTLSKLNAPNLEKLYIMDARPLVNAVANRANGGGYENLDNYKGCELVFLNIHNIHVMRESLRKIYDMAAPTTYVNSMVNQPQSSQQQQQSANPGANVNSGPQLVPLNAEEDKNFLVNLESSKWLEHIRSIFNGALRVVKCMQTQNASVLVHCSDGWDRTAQLTSLAMLMMDKYYRTIRGFEVLIEKEWLSYGHRFGTRMGHGHDKHADQDRSPIFLQFIDCVWQLLQQNPKVFEFNEKLLLTIVSNMYTCQFGTFLYNNEMEREKNECKQRTLSLWSYVNSGRGEFKNPTYNEYDGVVECSTSLAALQLWTNYYFQYKEIIDDSSISMQSSNSSCNGPSKTHTINNYNTAASVLTPPMTSSSKLFGQTFFQQMVQQMKASVRNLNQGESTTMTSSLAGNSGTSGMTAPTVNSVADTLATQSLEPELIKYKATSPVAVTDVF